MGREPGWWRGAKCGALESAAFVKGDSDIKLVETSLLIKSGERENVQLHYGSSPE